MVAGAADFAITTVSYLMAAAIRTPGLPVRFISVLHQRHPLAGMVRRDSGLRLVEDLAGRAAADHGVPWFVDEYRAALADHGIGAPPLVHGDGPYGAESLGNGDLDVVPSWIDSLPVIETAAGCEIDTIALGPDVYASGVVATDDVSDDAVRRMRDALAAGMLRQHEDPVSGISAFARQFPHVAVDRIVRSWSLFEPFASGSDSPGTMTDSKWAAAADYSASTHGLPRLAHSALYRRCLAADV